jgi:hypothetical protein
VDFVEDTYLLVSTSPDYKGLVGLLNTTSIASLDVPRVNEFKAYVNQIMHSSAINGQHVHHFGTKVVNIANSILGLLTRISTPVMDKYIDEAIAQVRINISCIMGQIQKQYSNYFPISPLQEQDPVVDPIVRQISSLSPAPNVLSPPDSFRCILDQLDLPNEASIMSLGSSLDDLLISSPRPNLKAIAKGLLSASRSNSAIPSLPNTGRSIEMVDNCIPYLSSNPHAIVVIQRISSRSV